MLRHFLFVDDHTFSTAKLKQAGGDTPGMFAEAAQQLFAPAQLTRKVNAYFKDVWYHQRNLSLLLAGCVVLMLGVAVSQRNAFFVVGSLVYFIGGSFLMFYFLRFPERIGYPLFYISALALLILPGFELNKLRERIQLHHVKALMGVALVALLIACGSTLYQVRKMDKKIRAYAQDEAYLNQLTQNGYVLRSANVIFSQWQDPLKVHPLSVSDIGPGWLVFSPAFYQRLQQFKLSHGSEILPWMVNNPNAYLITKKIHFPLVQTFMRTTYGIDTQIEVLGKLPKHQESIVYRLKRSRI